MFVWGKATLIVLLGILGLGVAMWVQVQRIDSLKADNASQAQLIIRLTEQLKMEQQAVQIQQEIANKFKVKMEQSNEQLKNTLQQETCAKVALPRDVISIINQLHNSTN
ncbi:hypothetical protein BTV20_02070 [Histophilus somni]|uniref:DUF2570 family protein n=1 Tax=Histophilus somni TaxID=731 RepID=A0A9Q7E544_HISSO|nr:DUF2570 family protein [Histophilus somni]ARU65737.1 hypothetical protein BTV18_02070 [Histophilus somni]ARU67606.1 hypothetical protein BTV19_02065 [Histophilus somni]ARU69486.1 hypothetical protein BTV16_02070 [Histophilus somni]ARU71363.1 hypothetical protein BTV20_02070 [Histophilus somni]ARU73238.1 hypothetical protein BTV17_02065 [Histophilus somni]